MVNSKHFLNCSAPICQADPNPNARKEVVWIPGEQVCTLKPYEKFQKQQIRINDLVRRRKFKVDRYFTVVDLEAL